MSADKPLSYKQEKFCHEYILDGNGAAAAIRAGYAAKYADRQAYQLLENNRVKTRIEELQNKALKRNNMEVDDLIQWLIKAATLKIDQFADVLPNGVILKDFDEIPEEWKPFIQEIQNTSTGGVQIKFIDKLGAIKELGKMLGAYEKDNSQKQQLPPIVVVQAKEDD